MAARDWIELEEIGGTAYLIKHFEVDTHEGYTSRSFHILRAASPEDIEEYQTRERPNFERQEHKK
jgi:hypothetical protein|tara:strand:- start:1144 stop:1338 length:195 start_codon:yes stop_codon:yes gene_type:complete